MSLLIIIMAVGFDYFSQNLVQWRYIYWFDSWAMGLASVLPVSEKHPGFLQVLLSLALPMSLVGIAQWLLSDVIYGLGAFLLSLLVLVYVFSPGQFFSRIESYLQSLDNKDAEAQSQAYEAMMADGEALDAQGLPAFIALANRDVFAILFWFVVLGPMGAVMYRFSVRLHALDLSDPDSKDIAQRLLGLLDWVPARLFSLGLALAGRFNKASLYLYEYALVTEDIYNSNQRLLAQIGHSALGNTASALQSINSADQLRAMKNLMVRGFGVCAVLLALLQLAGWLG